MITYIIANRPKGIWECFDTVKVGWYDFAVAAHLLRCIVYHVLHSDGATPGQMIWLEDPPPWLKPWLCPA